MDWAYVTSQAGVVTVSPQTVEMNGRFSALMSFFLAWGKKRHRNGSIDFIDWGRVDRIDVLNPKHATRSLAVEGWYHLTETLERFVPDAYQQSPYS
jgi:hypothetical protein